MRGSRHAASATHHHAHQSTHDATLLQPHAPASPQQQERLELLEAENDLLLGQQSELEAEVERLGGLLQVGRRLWATLSQTRGTPGGGGCT